MGTLTGRHHGPWFGLFLGIGLGVLFWLLAAGVVTCAVTQCLQ